MTTKRTVISERAPIEPNKTSPFLYCMAKSTAMKNVLSLISDTNISENATVNPDFAIAAKIEDGPPFTKAMSENNRPHPKSTRAIATG